MKEKLLVVLSDRGEDRSELSAEIAKLLTSRGINHEIYLAKSIDDLKAHLNPKRLASARAVAVHGGDGAVIAAMSQLVDDAVPLLVLPGGTANTVATYLRLPIDPLEALGVYVDESYVIDTLDVADINGELLVTDTHFGWWSEAVSGADKTTKRVLGKYAYGLRAITHSLAPIEECEFDIDKKSYRIRGKSLFVVNSSEQEVLGAPIFTMPHRPGQLQVALFKTSNMALWLLWFVYRKLSGRNLSFVLQTWRGAEVVIKKAPEPQMLDDNLVEIERPITISANRYRLKLIAPEIKAPTGRVKRLASWFKLEALRLYEGAKVFMLGRPSDRYSHIAPGLYLGGMYRQRAIRRIHEWGVTGVVNMRESEPIGHPKDLEVLHLATKDLHQPTLKNFQKGVDFISRHIKAGGGAYVHCRLGEGRGPSMAAAYLISTGLTADEAIRHIKKYRPFIRPTKRQMRQLHLWQKQVREDE